MKIPVNVEQPHLVGVASCFTAADVQDLEVLIIKYLLCTTPATFIGKGGKDV